MSTAYELARRFHELTINEMADVTGIDPDRVRSITEGSEDATVIEMVRFASCTGLSFSCFWNDTQRRKEQRSDG